jgi:cation diffusion facilitator family transporter
LETDQQAQREKRNAALTSVGAAAFLTVLKLSVGLLTNSLAILSEGINSALDIIQSSVTFLAVRISDQPPDEAHQYGHGKVENLSALIETLIILGMGTWVLYEAVSRLIAREVQVEVSIWSFVVMGISILVDLQRWRSLTAAGRKHRSQALEADGLHFQTDIWTGSLVMVGLAVVRVGDLFPAQRALLVRADALAAIAVAGVVAYLSIKMGRKSVDALLDRAPEGLEGRLREAIAGVEDVQELAQLRLRSAGPAVFVDATVRVRADLPAGLAHEIATGVERAAASVCPGCDTTVHVEPSSRWKDDLPARVRGLAAQSGLGVHDVRVHRLEDGHQIDLDLEVPGDRPLQETHELVTAFERAVEAELDGVSRVETHIEVAPPAPDGEGREITSRQGDLVERIRAIVEAQDEVTGCHDIRIREVEGALYASLHCRCPGGFTTEEAHRCSSRVEGRLRQSLPQVEHFLVHVEPD